MTHAHSFSFFINPSNFIMTSRIVSQTERLREIFSTNNSPGDESQNSNKRKAVAKDDDIAADFRWFSQSSRYSTPIRGASMNLAGNAKNKLIDFGTQTFGSEPDSSLVAISKKRSASLMEAVDQQVAEDSLGLNLSTTLPFHARRRTAATPSTTRTQTRFGLLRSPDAISRTRPLTTVVHSANIMPSNNQNTMANSSNSELIK
ncbi:hypothetical protein BDF19DRAFT_29379 [Syncephalis fuscata]|nr:hypothetical protein BDF19DRAFT_29379 [Syncephalis fuscata]